MLSLYSSYDKNKQELPLYSYHKNRCTRFGACAKIGALDFSMRQILACMRKSNAPKQAHSFVRMRKIWPCAKIGAFNFSVRVLRLGLPSHNDFPDGSLQKLPRQTAQNISYNALGVQDAHVCVCVCVCVRACVLCVYMCVSVCCVRM